MERHGIPTDYTFLSKYQWKIEMPCILATIISTMVTEVDESSIVYNQAKTRALEITMSMIAKDAIGRPLFKVSIPEAVLKRVDVLAKTMLKDTKKPKEFTTLSLF